MKKIIVFALCAVIMFSLTACGNTSKEADKLKEPSSNSVQMPDPFIDCATLEQAIKLAGFELTVPEKIDGFDNREIRVIENELIEVIYQNGEDYIVIRKAAGDEDISGDYNEYGESNLVTVNDIQVTMKGEHGQVYVAIWANAGYTYSVSSTGRDIMGMAELIQAIY